MHTLMYRTIRLRLLPASLFIGHCCRQQPVSDIAPAKVDPYDSKRHNKSSSKGTTQKEFCCLQPWMPSVLTQGIHVTALDVCTLCRHTACKKHMGCEKILHLSERVERLIRDRASQQAERACEKDPETFEVGIPLQSSLQ